MSGLGATQDGSGFRDSDNNLRANLVYQTLEFARPFAALKMIIEDLDRALSVDNPLLDLNAAKGVIAQAKNGIVLSSCYLSTAIHKRHFASLIDTQFRWAVQAFPTAKSEFNSKVSGSDTRIAISEKMAAHCSSSSLFAEGVSPRRYVVDFHAFLMACSDSQKDGLVKSTRTDLAKAVVSKHDKGTPAESAKARSAAKRLKLSDVKAHKKLKDQVSNLQKQIKALRLSQKKRKHQEDGDVDEDADADSD